MKRVVLVADEPIRANLSHTTRRLLRLLEEVLTGDVLSVAAPQLSCQIIRTYTVYDAPVIVVSSGIAENPASAKQIISAYKMYSGEPRLDIAKWLSEKGVAVCHCTHEKNAALGWRYNPRTKSYQVVK